MSLILDALNKSDRERPEQGPVPGLQSAHGPLAVQSLPWWRRYWLPQLAALGVVVGFAALLLAPPEAARQNVTEPAASGPADAGTAAAPAVAAASGALPGVPANAVVAGTGSDKRGRRGAVDVGQSPASALGPDPARVEPDAGETRSSGATARLPGQELVAIEAQSARPAGPAQAGVAELYAGRSAGSSPPKQDKRSALPPEPGAQSEVVTMPGRSFSQAIEAADTPVAGADPGVGRNAKPAASGLDVDQLTRAAEAELEAPPYEESPIPLVMELSQSERDKIPTVFYSAHGWSSSAAQSVVTLNGQSRREGDRIKPGLTLETILKSSIVLNYEGTRFRLRSLNSWVNL
jgi:hypothetical protein